MPGKKPRFKKGDVIWSYSIWPADPHFQDGGDYCVFNARVHGFRRSDVDGRLYAYLVADRHYSVNLHEAFATREEAETAYRKALRQQWRTFGYSPGLPRPADPVNVEVNVH